MTVEQTSVIDIAYIDPETEIMHLAISDHLAWDGEHLLILQEKINCYLAYVESGELLDALPNSKGRHVQIDVVAKYRPSEDALHFFGHAKDILLSAGFGFAYRPGPGGYHDEESCVLPAGPPGRDCS